MVVRAPSPFTGIRNSLANSTFHLTSQIFWARTIRRHTPVRKGQYPVTPDTVVPGEPDWLPPTYTDAGGFTPVNFD
jgi:hypothetical protein